MRGGILIQRVRGGRVRAVVCAGLVLTCFCFVNLIYAGEARAQAENLSSVKITGSAVLDPGQSKPRAIEDKESYRWLHAAEEASDVLAGAACITVVADRESDIYEQFARRPAGVQLLTRAAQDRSLADVGRLFATIDAWPEQHRETIVLPAQAGRRERTACLSLRFGAVSFASSGDGGQSFGCERGVVRRRCRRGRCAGWCRGAALAAVDHACGDDSGAGSTDRSLVSPKVDH